MKNIGIILIVLGVFNIVCEAVTAEFEPGELPEAHPANINTTNNENNTCLTIQLYQA
ncbi:MAG: hypothetical protein VX359_02455 [Chloroflexota bacterium]